MGRNYLCGLHIHGNVDCVCLLGIPHKYSDWKTDNIGLIGVELWGLCRLYKRQYLTLGIKGSVSASAA